MRPILLAACALGACTIQPADQNQTVNDTVVADNVVAETVPNPPPLQPVPDNAANGADTMTVTPAIDETAQGAADVVQRYYALISEKKYAEAWALWEDVGKASGMSAQAFAASFDKYATYTAQVGAPGAVDAGAGQRFVTVPVQVGGKLKTGALVSMTGSVTLHRTIVDGASAEQKSWRIRTADIKPRPDSGATTPPPPLDNRSTARYKCIDGSRMTAAFDPDNGKVTITRAGKTLVLKQERVASGVRYAAGGTSFAGKGESMTFTQQGLPPLPCSPIRR
ncbi:MAG: MliC family protein [Sphingomonas sp.]|uniref:MliC family protein n=1 Tax=Sphingomonas sp. TaxID=28214 RepID=UPI0025D38FD7|nr:MliC family protein [Sphingomonas sp.]MBX3565743.1 MliC family protein [Sphingomonas sp.]